MSTTTPNLGLTLPTPNVDTGWGGTLNTDFTTIDSIFKSDGTGLSVGLSVGSGKTMTMGGTMILGLGDGTGTVTAPTIRGAARTGTNAVGASLTIDAPNGTGTGGSGSIKFRTAPPGAAGTVADTMRTVLEIKNDGTVEVLGQDLSTVFAPGMIVDFGGTTAPTGWLFCSGAAVSRTTYADLFAAIGIAWGSGDGVTTFDLPDLRGRVTAGKDNMGGTTAGRITAAGSGITGTTLGAAGGLQNHQLSLAQIPSHAHNFTFSKTSSNSGGGTQVGNIQTTGLANTVTTQATGGTSPSGTTEFHNNTQPTAITNKIIKF
jgi:microcystin-dependent protein